MILDFPVNITRKTVAVSERGFGTILILDTETERDFTYLDAKSIEDLGEGKAKNIATRLFMQKPQPQAVAIIGSVGKGAEVFKKALEANKDFFFVVCTDNTLETIKAVSELCQVNNKVYAVTINDLEDVEALGKEVFDNTFVAYHDNADAYLAEGVAVIMSYKIGGKTAKFKQVQGVKEANISLTDLHKLHENKIFTYIKKL